LQDSPANIVVASFRRSGTHLAIDSIRNNTLGVGARHLTLETLLPSHKEHVGQDPFEMERRSGGCAIIKTHELPDAASFADHPPLRDYVRGLMDDSKVVYALRDGRDVMVSFYEYRKKFDQNLKDVSFSEFLRRPAGGHSNAAAWWSAHVNAWLSRDVFPLYYEDMHEDFPATLARMAAYLGLPLRSKIFDTVISRNAAAADVSSAVLYRRGQVGDHADYFSADDRMFFEREAGAGMALYQARKGAEKSATGGASTEKKAPASPRAIRYLAINTFYPAYLMDFYTARPNLQDAPYDVQIDALLDDGFCDPHIFTRVLRPRGFETMHVIANNGLSQAAWAKEQGLSNGGKVDGAVATLEQIDRFAPDIVYTTDVETLHSPFFRRLKKRPKVIAGWRGFPLAAQTDLSDFDLILTSFDRIFEEAKARGAKHVERFHPGFPEYSPALKEPRDIKWDVVISGTVTHQHMKRVQMIDMLAEMSLDPAAPFKLGLFMPNVWALSPLAQSMNRGARWGHDMYKLLRDARIVVNIDVDAFGAQPPNMRLIEATGAGAFLLTSHHPELKNFFEPAMEVETFRTPMELASKVLFYLSQPALCDEIATRAQARCLAEHGLVGQRTAWFERLMRDALTRAEA
jgi:spore maturation protein CgeB